MIHSRLIILTVTVCRWAYNSYSMTIKNTAAKDDNTTSEHTQQ